MFLNELVIYKSTICVTNVTLRYKKEFIRHKIIWYKSNKNILLKKNVPE